MNLIGSVSGIVGIYAPSESIMPEAGLPTADLISFLINEYAFPATPSSQGPMQSIIQFNGGVFTNEQHERVHFNQLSVCADGDVIHAQDTNYADQIMTDYLSKLESHLKYRIKGKAIRKVYHSILVVDFAERAIAKLDNLPFSSLVRKAAGFTGDPVSVKRLAYGHDASNAVPAIPGVLQIIPRDFVLERRANEPMDSNRFFCSAPLPTLQHLNLLEELESSLV